MDTSVTTTKTSLLSTLVKRQKLESLTDDKFANKLGISKPLWKATKRNKRNINRTLLKAIAQTYPDMDQDILDFLKDSTSEK